MTKVKTDFAPVAAKIAGEAIDKAKTAVGKTGFPGEPVYLHADKNGTWQIHSTSFLLTVDASVPLTAGTTESAAELAHALVDSFERKAA